MKIEKRYLDGTYLNNNPDWDRADAYWKADIVGVLLKDFKISPKKLCEVGCGSGDILDHLQRNYFPDSKCFGFDIAPDLEKFWQEHLKDSATKEKLYFKIGDFHKINQTKYDVLCMLDVFEHVRDPYTFLESSIPYSEYFVFHIPLDLSVSSVLRGSPLLHVRRKVGHLHFYTKELAIETLEDCGFEIMQWKYTGASFNSPNRSLKTRIASIPRRIISLLNKDFAVRLFGGETLIVLARSNKKNP